MRAGDLKIRGQGTCHKFDLRKNCMVTFRFSNRKVGKRSKPWWDQECQEAVNNRKKCYQAFIKCPGKHQLL